MASRAQMRAKMQIAAGKGNKVDYSKGFQQKPQSSQMRQNRQVSQDQRASQPGPGNTTVRQANAMSRERRTGQTGALGMLSERLSQGLNKKKKMAGQQNAMAQRGIMQQLMAQRQQGQQGQQGGVQGFRQRLQAQQGRGNTGGISRFTQPANLQDRQIGGNFEEPMADMRTRRRGIVQE